MTRFILCLLLIGFTSFTQAQEEKYPVFDSCSGMDSASLITCFKAEVKKAVQDAFILPDKLKNEKFEGLFNVLFIVTNEGKFQVIYVNSPYAELKEEVERVFNDIPDVAPATYNNHPVEMHFIYPLQIPFGSGSEEPIEESKDLVDELGKLKAAFSGLGNQTLFPEHHSALNIPLTHHTYVQTDQILDQQDNEHSAMKPYSYRKVNSYKNLDDEKQNLMLSKTTWFGRKLFNEHMAYVKGKDFWFTIDPIADVQAGKDNHDTKTFNNTRGVQIQGALGKKLNFSTSFYESQGRFADYVNSYANSIKPDGGDPAIIPGRGIAKEFKTDAYDYPVAEAYINYTPNNTFSFQFGKGRNFIGDGYRSLILSDVASPYPYFKINTTFWKVKYTNLWMWGQDVRPELTKDGAFRQKYMAIHYLSWNVSKKINLGLFETVIWDNVNDRGFDINYLNPIIFYTATEFATGTRAGNALLGLSFKYKFKKASLYSQLLIDEFRVSEMTSNDGWWANKFGFQLGLKYYDAFQVENLFLQAEYNAVKPYTYSHDELNYNFGHNNQPLAHLWGSNFREAILRMNYQKNRWFYHGQMVFGKKGFDFHDSANDYSYGGNIFTDNDLRAAEYGNEIGQGNAADIFIADLQAGYLLNPATNLKVFAGITFRNFDAQAPTGVFDNTNTTWFSVGLRTDVFNWYFDF
jgi:hypothetical protein